MRLGARLHNLRHASVQSALAIAAIATAVALPVTLLSVGGGVADHEVRALEQAGYQVSVSGPGTHGIENAHELSSRITAIPDVADASPILSTPVDVFGGAGGARPALAEGVIPAAFSATQPPTERALLPSPLPLGDPDDSVHFANGTYGGPATNDLLLSTPLAQVLGVRVGASVLLGATTDPNQAVPFTVTGLFGLPPALLGPTAADAVILPLSDLQVLTGQALNPNSNGGLLDGADTIQVGLVGAATLDPSRVDTVANSVQALVPYYGVTSLTQEAAQLEGSVAILDGFYLGLSSVSLTVGFLFLAIILVRRVERNRPSIAVRRALGVPGRFIAGEILGEGVLLAAVGSAGGIVGGYAIVVALSRWGAPDVAEIARLGEFQPLTLALLFLGALALSLPAGAYATRAALRLNVAEALR